MAKSSESADLRRGAQANSFLYPQLFPKGTGIISLTEVSFNTSSLLPE